MTTTYFYITPLASTRLVLDEIHRIIKLLLMMHCEFLFLYLMIWFFLLQQLDTETDAFELASTITHALQTNRLAKCASYPSNISYLW